jgi:hypothetical protein
LRSRGADENMRRRMEAVGFTDGEVWPHDEEES